MSAIYASMTVFFLAGGISFALYVAIYGSHRPFDERITEIGVKMRVAYGNPLNLDMESDTFARSLFRWLAKRLPEPGLNTPKGEKIAQTLIRAGFSRPCALRVFHFTGLACTAGLAVLALIVSIAMGVTGIEPLIFVIIGAGLGAFAPSYDLTRTAKKRQQEI